MTWVCSYGECRTGHSLRDSSFWHMRCLREDPLKTGKVESIVECGFMDNHSLTVNVLESGPNGNFEFDGDS